MSDRPPNQIARVIAVAGLITMFILVIIVIATSGGGGSDSSSSDSGSGSVINSSGPDKNDPKIQEALQKGIYVVQKGDTLTSISDATGIGVDTLITLNPTTDPQALPEGTHLKLK